MIVLKYILEMKIERGKQAQEYVQWCVLSSLMLNLVLPESCSLIAEENHVQYPLKNVETYFYNINHINWKQEIVRITLSLIFMTWQCTRQPHVQDEQEYF
jgi:hypothetical protein